MLKKNGNITSYKIFVENMPGIRLEHFFNLEYWSHLILTVCRDRHANKNEILE